MNDNDKEYGRDLCKSHSARMEKEFCRVCPSKLNKKELEDVYFSLLESNLDLKKTINTQCDKIKVLSTKIQRLTTVQKTYLGTESKQCCGGKVLINEQRESISELQRSNQCLSERVRQLNMRLCSAKQFMKRSPFQSTSRCNRCSNKNASMSALITKRSESNLRTALESNQYLDKDIVSSRTADNDIISHEKGVQYDFCVENKCRTRLEELKEKNDNLQEELSRINEEHATRISEYEQQLSELRAENLRVRSRRAQAEDRLKELKEEATELTRRLGMAEIHGDELSVELSIEKRKVSELEMRVKAADMSSRIASAIEAHLNNIKLREQSTNIQYNSRIETPTVDESPRLVVPSPRNIPKAAARTKIPHLVEEVFKNSDDSGYTEINKSHEIEEHKAATYINQVLMEKIADLQNQINNLKVFKGYADSESNLQALEASLNTNTETNQSNDIIINGKQSIPFTFEEHIISESSDSVVTEKKLNTTTIVGNKDGQKENERKVQKMNSQAEDKVNGLTKNIPVNTTLPKELQENKLDKNQIENNINSKQRESFKQFRKRSKEKRSLEKKLTDTRKLSLESSRDHSVERKLTKTGSLDEKRVSDVDSNEEIKGTHKIIKSKENTSKLDSLGESNNSKNVIKNIQELKKSEERIPDASKINKVHKSDDITKGPSRINAQNVDKTTHSNDGTNKTTANESENNKSSDSSKGTYSIHRDDIVKTGTDINFNSNGNKQDKILKDRVTHKEASSNILIADVKRNLLNSAVSKDKLMPERRRSSSPSQSRTYLIPLKEKDKPLVSPDSTEYEMSSFSDLPLEKDESSDRKYRSPGEARPTTASESRADTTDYGSLSEGELPCTRESTILSAGETRVPNRTGKSHSLPLSTSQQMAEALSAVQQELARCTTLLKVRPRRSLDGVPAK
ncbi:uncharacterized protein [Epargyreus clarus]|uniref:uncharacterized protein n=1 Tax=Epargyreus clarus TaxID=520877 RepID=UPI003C2DA4F4